MPLRTNSSRLFQSLLSRGGGRCGLNRSSLFLCAFWVCAVSCVLTTQNVSAQGGPPGLGEGKPSFSIDLGDSSLDAYLAQSELGSLVWFYAPWYVPYSFSRAGHMLDA